MAYTAHIDTFARDHLPPVESQPEFLFDLPELHYPDQLNAAVERGCLGVTNKELQRIGVQT